MGRGNQKDSLNELSMSSPPEFKSEERTEDVNVSYSSKKQKKKEKDTKADIDAYCSANGKFSCMCKVCIGQTKAL